MLPPPNMSHRGHPQRSDRIPNADHLDLLLSSRHEDRIRFGNEEIFPLFAQAKGDFKVRLGHVSRVEVDEFSHGGRSDDPDLVHQPRRAPRRKGTTGEAEKVELIATGEIVDDVVVGLDDVLEKS